ncbi:uncharacterized protein LOC144328334 [Podarcis muralis]
MLAATYCGLAAHEEASVRASAIEHLGLLRGWARDQRLPITTTEEEAIHELVVVLIHLEDEDLEVAKAARRALSHLAPEVKWWARSNKFSLHFALHQAAKHLVRSLCLCWQLCPGMSLGVQGSSAALSSLSDATSPLSLPTEQDLQQAHPSECCLIMYAAVCQQPASSLQGGSSASG